MPEPSMVPRRALFASLVLISAIGAVYALMRVLGADGLSAVDIGMLACFMLTLPWTLIGFWNALIGFCLLRRAVNVNELLDPVRIDPAAPLHGRTALVMCAYNEDPARVFKHLQKMAADLHAKGLLDSFDIHLLSDSTEPSIIDEEARRFGQWRERFVEPGRLHYRRRTVNTDHKNGNLWEFLNSRHGDYDYFLLLDADSLMSAERIAQMVRRMDIDPKLGIYQPLIVGLPNSSPFARIFQFGMRQGMRAYTAGASWWTGAAGPCWGHNVIIRMAPFVEHCCLPRLPGGPPLGGLVLSHDQIEAALLRGAGYDVRTLVEEAGSYEENPPTLQDFIKRDLRWCQGNMQYFGLLAMPGVTGMGRLQMVLAILMYVAAPAWLAFMLLGIGYVVWPSMSAGALSWEPVAVSFGIGLFAMMMTANFTPKIAGITDILCRPEARQAYGGTGRVLAASFLELIFALFLAPIVAVSQTIFVIGLLFGRTIRWETQQRSLSELSFLDAFRGMWPQTLLGASVLGLLWLQAPGLLPWTLPVFGSLLLAAPFAWLTSRRSIGLWLERTGICATPEELNRPELLQPVRVPGTLSERPMDVQEAAA